VAVGGGDPERLADALAGGFDSLRTRAASGPAAKVQVPVPGVRVEQRERQQSALAMLFPGPARHDPARNAAEVWAAIAGGLGGTLFEALRSQRSLAYTVFATSWQRRATGALLTYIAMAPERLEEARAAMLDELSAFRTSPPAAEELDRAKAMLAGQAEMSRQSAGSFAAEIADAWILGAGLDELERPGDRYRSVTAEQVQAVAISAFDPASRAEGVLEARPAR